MRLLLAVLTLFIAAPALAFQDDTVAAVAESEAPSPAGPAMWVMKDEDTTIYLLGTIHTLPDNYEWRTDTLDTAIDASEKLWVETRISQLNPLKLLALMGRTAIDRSLPPVRERIHPDLVDNFERAIEGGLFPERGLDNLETWAVALLLVDSSMDDIEVSGDNGVEENLEEWFEEGGKPISGLETIEEGLGFFDKMSQEAQVAFLHGMIAEDDDDEAKQYLELLEIWATGDVEGIADIDWGDDPAATEIMEIILYERNANWVEWIQQRMEAPGTIMVAVGAAHMAGDRSVIDMLEKSGRTVTRLQ